MLDACWLESLSRQMGAQDANFGGKRKIGEVGAAVWKLLFDFKYLDASNAGFMGIFLGASQFAAMTPRAILEINEQTVFRFFIIHADNPVTGFCKPGIAGS